MLKYLNSIILFYIYLFIYLNIYNKYLSYTLKFIYYMKIIENSVEIIA